MAQPSNTRGMTEDEYNKHINQMRNVNNQYDEREYADDVEFGNLNTVVDIGYHLTQRMTDSIQRARADADIAYNSPPS
jgi:hypothetical protein